MRIVHCSDIHFGTEDPALVAGLERRVGEIAPDLIVASGDFTMAGRAREYRPAAALLRRLADATGAAVVATPGNHDLPVYNIAERFLRPLARYRKWIGPVSQQAFVDERCAVLSLNSARRWDLSLNWSHGRLSKGQIKEADRFFAAAADVPFRALVVHHPFHVPEELPGFRRIGRGDAMLGVLARRRVHAVLSGHLHLREVIAREIVLEAEHESGAEAGTRTVRLVQAGTATSVRERDAGERNSFNLIRVGDGRTFSVEPQVWDGAGFSAGESVVAERVDEA